MEQTNSKSDPSVPVVAAVNTNASNVNNTVNNNTTTHSTQTSTAVNTGDFSQQQTNDSDEVLSAPNPTPTPTLPPVVQMEDSKILSTLTDEQKENAYEAKKSAEVILNEALKFCPQLLAPYPPVSSMGHNLNLWGTTSRQIFNQHYPPQGQPSTPGSVVGSLGTGTGTGTPSPVPLKEPTQLQGQGQVQAPTPPPLGAFGVSNHSVDATSSHGSIPPLTPFPNNVPIHVPMVMPMGMPFHPIPFMGMPLPPVMGPNGQFLLPPPGLGPLNVPHQPMMAPYLGPPPLLNQVQVPFVPPVPVVAPPPPPSSSSSSSSSVGAHVNEQETVFEYEVPRYNAPNQPPVVDLSKFVANRRTREGQNGFDTFPLPAEVTKIEKFSSPVVLTPQPPVIPKRHMFKHVAANKKMKGKTSSQ